MLSTNIGKTVIRYSALQQGQRRFGGSLTKNKHVENYNNWRGDSEKRFKFDTPFFVKSTLWFVIPTSLYCALSFSERNGRDDRNSLAPTFRK